MAEPNEQPKTVSDNPQPATDKPTELPHVQSPPLSPELKTEPVRERIAPQPLEPMRPVRRPRRSSTRRRPRRNASFALPAYGSAEAGMPGFSRACLPAAHRKSRRNHDDRRRPRRRVRLGHEQAAGKPEPPQRDAVLIEENARLQKSVGASHQGACRAENQRRNHQQGQRRSQFGQAQRPARQVAPETTGSISKPAVAAPPPAPPASMPSAEPPPLPPARPSGVQLERRPLPIIQGWTICQVRNGVAWVDNRGELFAAQPGVPLPGLGAVEAVRREGYQWIVITPKGIISSAGESTAGATRGRSSIIRPIIALVLGPRQLC